MNDGSVAFYEMDATALVKCDFDVICRLCLCRDGPLTCLFSHGEEIPLYLIAQTCAAVDIYEDDGLPRNICCACRDTILSSYQFRQQVCRNDTILRCIAGMKPDPDEEGINEVAVVTVMADEPPGIVDNGGSELQDGGVNSRDIYTVKVNQDEEEESYEGFNAHFLVGEGNRTVCEDTHSRIGEPGVISRRGQWSNQSNMSGKTKPIQNTTIRHIYPIQAYKNREISTDIAKSHPILTKTTNTKPGQNTSGQKIRTDAGKIQPLRTKTNNTKLVKSGTVRHIASARAPKIQEISTDIAKSHPILTKTTNTKPGQNTSGRKISTGTGKIHPLRTKTKNTKPVKSSTVSREIQAKINKYGIPDGKGYHCKRCKVFYNKRTFITHINRKHLKIRDFMCDQCGRSFFAKPHLSYHIKSIHLDPISAVIDEVDAKMKECGTLSQNGDSYFCNLCRKVFVINSFKKHVQYTHLQIRKFMCDQCGYRAFSKYYLTQHIDGIHLKVKKYQCPHCPLRFCAKPSMNIHARTHSQGGPRRVMCEVCGKSLTTKADLMRHLRAQHFPELKIKCEFCDCRYACHRKLREHVAKVH